MIGPPGSCTLALRRDEPMDAIFTTVVVQIVSNQMTRLVEALAQAGRNRLEVRQTPGGRLRVSFRLSPPNSKAQEQLAWTTYVHIATRVSTVPMSDDEGLDREALDSLHALFDVLRHALTDAGPSVARFDGNGTPIGVAVSVMLNVVIRPFLSRWHPRLQVHEAHRPPDRSAHEHELAWEHHSLFREDLRTIQDGLTRFCVALEESLELGPLCSLRELEPLPEFGT